MFDFRDIRAASKAEQVRAWSIEQAIESFSGLGPITNQELTDRADRVEAFVLNGKEEQKDV